MRNYVFLYAIENDLDLPIGSLDAHILDPDTQDEDSDSLFVALHLENDRNADSAAETDDFAENYAQRAQAAYDLFNGRYKRRFKWLRASLFTDDLGRELQEDIDRLTEVVQVCGDWNVAEDTKLAALHRLISADHAQEKVLVFSQFADTIRYLQDELTYLGTTELEAATGQHDNPTALAHRFSPVSNELPRESQRVKYESCYRPMSSVKGRTSKTAPSSSITTCPGPSSACHSEPAVLTALDSKRRRSAATPSCRRKALKTLFVCDQGCGNGCKRTAKSLVRTSNSSKTTNTRSSCGIYTPRNPASSTSKRIAKSTCRRMLIKNGPMPPRTARR